MQVDITIKNYRRFEDTHPLRLVLDGGIAGFVGLNNSGKSSVLRFFYEFRGLWNLLSQPSGEVLEALRGNARPFSPHGVFDYTESFSNSNDRDISIDFEFPRNESHPSAAIVPTRLEIIATRQSNLFTATLWTPTGKVEGVGGYDSMARITESGGRVLADLSDFMKFFGGLRDALYVGPFRNAITTGSGQHYDINVGASFIETWHAWQTGPTKRQNDAIQAVVRDIRHIFGYQELEIHAAKESNTLQIFADGKSYKLQELGAGIAQFIVVLGNAAVKNPGLILIDEPETGLHPSLQLDFLTSLAAYSRGGLLFATHSIGLARSGADRVHSVRTVGPRSEVTPYEATPRLAEFLGEMSFSGFQELGFSKVLLVEGATDIKTVQQFLRMLKKDHQVVPLSLGGSEMINGGREAELAEILRITPEVAALIDSERDAAIDSCTSNVLLQI